MQEKCTNGAFVQEGEMGKETEEYTSFLKLQTRAFYATRL
jgi:hypothetical protein